MGETPPSATAAMAAKRAALAERRKTLADQAVRKRQRSWRLVIGGVTLAMMLGGGDYLTGAKGWSVYPIAGLLTGLGWILLRLRRNN